MKAILFLFKPNQKQISIINNWMSFTELEYEIFALPQCKPEDILKDQSNIIVISFGLVNINLVDRAARTHNIQHIQLPSLNELVYKEENEQRRLSTKRTLEKLSLLKDEEQEEKLNLIDTDNLPELSIKQMLALAKQLTDEPEKSFIHFTDDKLVQVGGERQDNTDIYLSPLELIQIGILRETLNIKQIELKGKN